MFHCSRQDAPWTQITTDWEHLYGLTIIKSWRFHFLKEKISTTGQKFELYSLIIYSQNQFLNLTQLSKIERKVFSKFSQVNLMIPFLPKLTWTLSIAFLNVYVSLEDHSSPLHVQNEASPRSKFSPYFFLLISFKALQDLKTVDGN